MVTINPLLDYGRALQMRASKERYVAAEEGCARAFHKKTEEYTSGYADSVRDYKKLSFLQKLILSFGFTPAKFNAAIKVDEGEYPLRTK